MGSKRASELRTWESFIMGISQGLAILRVGSKHREKLRISMTGTGDFVFAVCAYPSGKRALKRINGDNAFA